MHRVTAERVLRPLFCLRAGRRFDASAPTLPVSKAARGATDRADRKNRAAALGKVPPTTGTRGDYGLTILLDEPVTVPWWNGRSLRMQV